MVHRGMIQWLGMEKKRGYLRSRTEQRNWKNFWDLSLKGQKSYLSPELENIFGHCFPNFSCSHNAHYICHNYTSYLSHNILNIFIFTITLCQVFEFLISLAIGNHVHEMANEIFKFYVFIMQNLCEHTANSWVIPFPTEATSCIISSILAFRDTVRNWWMF